MPSVLGNTETIGGVSVVIGANLDGLRAGEREAKRVTSELRREVERPMRIQVDTSQAIGQMRQLATEAQRAQSHFASAYYQAGYAMPVAGMPRLATAGGFAGGGFMPGAFGPGTMMMRGVDSGGLAAEVAMFGMDSEARRRFSATRAGGSSGPAGASRGGAFMRIMMGMGLLHTGLRLGTGIARIGSSELENQIAGIKGLASVPFGIGATALEMAEAISGTTLESIMQGVNISEQNLVGYGQYTKTRRRENEGMFAAARGMGIEGMVGVKQARARANFERDEGYREVKYQLADKKISAEAAKSMRQALDTRLVARLVEIEDQAALELSRIAGQTGLSQFRLNAKKTMTGTDASRAIGRQEIIVARDYAIQQARTTGGDVGAVEALYAGQLAEFDRDANIDRLMRRRAPGRNPSNSANAVAAYRREREEKRFMDALATRVEVANARGQGFDQLGGLIQTISGMRLELASPNLEPNRRQAIVDAQRAELRAMESQILGFGRTGYSTLGFDPLHQAGTGQGEEQKKILEAIRDYLREIARGGGMN